MGKIAMMSYTEKKNKLIKKTDYYYKNILGKDILKIDISKKIKDFKSIKKILVKENINSMVLSGDTKIYENDVSGMGIRIFDGKKLMCVIAPDIIKFMCVSKNVDFENIKVFIYTDTPDKAIKDMISDMTSLTKFISVISSDACIYKFADEILTDTGVAMSLGDSRDDGITIIDRYDYHERDMMINLSRADIKGAVNRIIFQTEKGEEFSSDIIEAIIRSDISRESFKRLNLKFKYIC